MAETKRRFLAQWRAQAQHTHPNITWPAHLSGLKWQDSRALFRVFTRPGGHGFSAVELLFQMDELHQRQRDQYSSFVSENVRVAAQQYLENQERILRKTVYFIR
jgi:hypothetical protein